MPLIVSLNQTPSHILQVGEWKSASSKLDIYGWVLSVLAAMAWSTSEVYLSQHLQNIIKVSKASKLHVNMNFEHSLCQHMRSHHCRCNIAVAACFVNYVAMVTDRSPLPHCCNTVSTMSPWKLKHICQFSPTFPIASKVDYLDFGHYGDTVAHKFAHNFTSNQQVSAGHICASLLCRSPPVFLQFPELILTHLPQCLLNYLGVDSHFSLLPSEQICLHKRWNNWKNGLDPPRQYWFLSVIVFLFVSLPSACISLPSRQGLSPHTQFTSVCCLTLQIII